jgi:hypothetical protein
MTSRTWKTLQDCADLVVTGLARTSVIGSMLVAKAMLHRLESGALWQSDDACRV